MRSRILLSSPVFCGVLISAALSVTGCGQADKPTHTNAAAEIKLDVLTYDQLEAAIKAQGGKVVVVDVWGDFCLPCKREFPNLVKLHERYAKDGVVCMSVSVDPAENRAAALAFLKTRGATFSNYLLDEGDGLWDKWDFKGVPAVFVFDRAGKRVGNFTNDDPDNQFTYADVEKLVQKLIAPSS
jgi:thiol-disulfide isomerase/thioredoxin